MKPEFTANTFLKTYNTLSRDAPGQPGEDRRKAVLERLQQGDVPLAEVKSLLPDVPEAEMRAVVDELMQLRLVEVAGESLRLSPHARRTLSYLSVA